MYSKINMTEKSFSEKSEKDTHANYNITQRNNVFTKQIY